MSVRFLVVCLFAFFGFYACSESGDKVTELDVPGQDNPKDEEAKTISRHFKISGDFVASGISVVRVVELDFALEETGRTFKIEKSDSGYIVDSLPLRGRYALVRIEDFSFPDIYLFDGIPVDTETKVNLDVLVDMDNYKFPYVTLAGHLVTARVKHLVAQGMAPDSAIVQAESELYEAFAFESDELLDAPVLDGEVGSDSWYASRVIHDILKQFTIFEGFNDAFGELERQLVQDGKFENYDTFIVMADFLAQKARRDNMHHAKTFLNGKLVVAENKFIRQFYTKVYGLKPCSEDSVCTLTALKKTGSELKDSTFICLEDGWLFSYDNLNNTCGFGKGEPSEIRNGAIDSTIKFYYNEASDSWNRCDSLESEIGMCTPSREGEYIFMGDSGYYKCRNWSWINITRDEYNLRNIDSVDCDTMEYRLGLDSVTYYGCKEGRIWALSSEELNTMGVPCDTTPDFVLGNDSVTKYVCDAQILRRADSLELMVGKGCNWYSRNDTAFIWNSYYKCKGRWTYMHDLLYLDAVTDARDGKTYPLVGMGRQLWFAADLDYETENSWCYDDDPMNCIKYGRLYKSIDAASQNKDSLLCPKGFHVPTQEDFENMVTFMTNNRPSNSSIGPLLKSVDSHGSDYYGFHADLAGVRTTDGTFSYFGNIFYMCTSSKEGANSYYRWRLGEDLAFTYASNSASQTCYVRCLADEK